jgi:hypothetical protein
VIFLELEHMAVVEDQKQQEKRPLAEQPRAPAYWAMDYYFDNLKKIVSSAPSGGTEFGEKIKSYAMLRRTSPLLTNS